MWAWLKLSVHDGMNDVSIFLCEGDLQWKCRPKYNRMNMYTFLKSSTFLRVPSIGSLSVYYIQSSEIQENIDEI